MKKCFLLLSLCVIFLSCENNAFYNEMFRTTEDPFDDVPKSNSLILDNSVYLEWENDPAADIYELYRSSDGINLSFNLVYRGTNLYYIDEKLPENDRYIYRLDKIRGKKHFVGTKYAFGYSSTARGDSCENNDKEERATFLESDLTCNLPCVRYITNNEEKLDVDWFYIELPARRTAYIVIKQKRFAELAPGASTDLLFKLPGEESRSVKQGDEIPIENKEFESRIIKFEILPDTTNLFTVETSHSTVITYDITYNQFRKY